MAQTSTMTDARSEVEYALREATKTRAIRREHGLPVSPDLERFVDDLLDELIQIQGK